MLPAFYPRPRYDGAVIESVGEAPGRVNLIGEHTDYNGGYVLPIATPQRTRVRLRTRTDLTISARSPNVSPPGPVQYEWGTEARRGTWIDYVQGITDVLRRNGYRIGGADLEIASEVPVGSGLSSSAALEIALMRAFRDAYRFDLPDETMARLAQQAEHEFVGAPVGIMDQIACTFADAQTALFLDTRSLHRQCVPIPDGSEILVIDSGIAHDHARGDYRMRRAECEEAARRLGVSALRDCGLDDLPRAATLPAPLGRRARHVVTENARVLEAVAAFRAADLARIGRLFTASHDSLRDDFDVSVPEVDRLVELANEQDEVYGARLTGGGFGGSIVGLARRGTARQAAEQIVSRYRKETGRTASVLLPRVISGAA